MTSINTNTSAMAALQTLRTINSGLETTQGRVSSGFRVGEAKDNAAYWSIATTMRSDNKAVGAAADALGLGAAKVDVAYAAIEAGLDVLNEIKAKVTSATESTVDKDKVANEIAQLGKELASIAESASFNGENWALGSATQSVVTGFVRTSSGVKVTTETFTGLNMFGNNSGAASTNLGVLSSVYAINSTSLTGATSVSATLTSVETAIAKLNEGGAALGSLSKRIDIQTEFAQSLSDAIDKGVSKLVDANMEEESARLSALQTQQQLAIQSLSIANSSSQNILSLFR